MSNSRKVSLKGSERTVLAGARSIGPTDPHQLMEISVVLKHRQPLPINLNAGTFMNHNDFARMYGADPENISKIREFAAGSSLLMLERGDEILRRTVTLAGTAAAMEKAFSVELNEYEHPNGSYRGRTGAIKVPEDLARFIQGVFGLDDRPVAKPHLHYRGISGAFGVRSPNASYTPTQVAHLYDFPRDVTGTGQTIGLIELGGGYRPTDIQEYFESLGLHAPLLKTVSVDHGKNRPTTPESVDGEVMLDIEVSGAVAPGSAIAVYFAPNTSRGFQDAISTAIHDQINNPFVISISWGNAEVGWTGQSMQSFDQVAQEAGLLGITITVASGDCGSNDAVRGGKNYVDFPASCPHVLAAGGTRMTSAWGSISNESVWNDNSPGGATGGGFSEEFARPAWQDGVTAEINRGVPDVAANADPQTGYYVLVDGQKMVVGGTSAAAPLWAGLIALCNEKMGGRMGFVNPRLYEINQMQAFHDITEGDNGAFTAATGWDAATGLGTPKGIGLLQAVQTHANHAHLQAQSRMEAAAHSASAG